MGGLGSGFRGMGGGLRREGIGLLDGDDELRLL